MQNGTITISIDGGAVPTNYTIAWFEGNGTTTPLGTATTGTTTANNTVAQNLPAGIYTVQVTDNTTPGNSCLSTATFTVVDNQAIIVIAQNKITTVDQTDCTPANGSAKVTDILVNNASIGGTTGYTFTWLQSDGVTRCPRFGQHGDYRYSL